MIENDALNYNLWCAMEVPGSIAHKNLKLFPQLHCRQPSLKKNHIKVCALAERVIYNNL